jgi:NADH:ubiquinone oxidoreductase subunit 4 (subunit M)
MRLSSADEPRRYIQDVQGPSWEVTALLDTIRRILGYQLTIAQLIALGLIVGTPYLLIGAIWSTTHTAHLQNMHGVDLAVSFLGSIVSWPVLLFSNVCMT